MSECICNKPDCWGYTCPVHKIICRATTALIGQIEIKNFSYEEYKRALLTDDLAREWVYSKRYDR